MAFRKHKPLWLLLLLAMLGAPMVAFALIGPKNVEPEMRVFTRVVPNFVVSASTDTSTGTAGVIGVISVYGAGAVIEAPSASTPELGAFPYPTKVIVVLVDGGAGSGAITCTSLLIRGRNQFGQLTSETLTTLTETEQTSARVYSEILGVTAAGCAIASGGDTSDYLHIRTSSWVGLPGRIRSASDINTMCLNDVSATPDTVICYRGSGTITTSQESLDEAGAVDVDDNAVDVSDATLDTPAATLDGITLTVFSPVPLP